MQEANSICQHSYAVYVYIQLDGRLASNPPYCQFFDCSLELIKVKIKIRLSLVQDIIWLLPQGGHGIVEPVVVGLDPLNV